MSQDAGRLAYQELQIAHRLLEQSKHELTVGYFDAAISRSYYATFHAARAALRLAGSDPTTHKGTVNEFGRLLVKTGQIEKEYSAILREARDERQVVDYEVYELEHLPSEAYARNIVDQGGKFISRIEMFIEKKLKKLDNNVVTNESSH